MDYLSKILQLILYYNLYYVNMEIRIKLYKYLINTYIMVEFVICYKF